MLSIHLCEKCHKNLNHYGVLAVETYYDIVENYLHDGCPVEIASHFFPILQFLEQKNFIISTEIDINRIAAKPVDIPVDCTEASLEVCWDPEEHQKKAEEN